jgi:hypothetical protein
VTVAAQPQPKVGVQFCDSAASRRSSSAAVTLSRAADTVGRFSADACQHSLITAAITPGQLQCTHHTANRNPVENSHHK